MPASFDLSPVISLLGSFSHGEQQRNSSDIRSLPTPGDTSKDVVQNIRERRTLGDFTTLWQYLQSERGEKSEESESGITESTGVTPATQQPPSLTAAFTSVQLPASSTVNVRVAFDTYDALRKQANSIPTAPKAVTAPTSTPKKNKAAKSITFTPTKKDKKIPKKDVTTPTPKWDYSKGPIVIKPKINTVDRKVLLIKKLVTLFPETSTGLLKVPSPLTPAIPSDTDIHIFVDNSNILISFYEHIKRIRGIPQNAKVKRPVLSFHALSLVMERGRNTAKRVLVGSSPLTREISEAKEIGYQTNILERVEKERPEKSGNYTTSSGSETAATKTRKRKVEQAVDEILHLKILESVLDYPPSTVVLASGDGAAGEYSEGFFKMIERCLVKGWSVEIVSFKRNLNAIYRQKEFRVKWKGKFKTVALDHFTEELLD